MTRKIAKTFASFALALMTASSLVACDSGEESVQTIEEGVSEEGAQLLLAAADLDEAADFAIYKVELPEEEQSDAGFQITNSCALPSDAAVASSCGWCGCDPVTGGTICIDYQCNPMAFAKDAGDLPLANGHSDPAPEDFTLSNGASEPAEGKPFELGRADGETCSPGSNWQNACNVCSCLPDGTAACTQMACGESLNSGAPIADPMHNDQF